MDAIDTHGIDASGPTANTGGSEGELNKLDVSKGISSSRETVLEIENAGEVLTRVELDLACSSDKLANLNMLMLHVATRESEFEAFVSEKEHILSEPDQGALEFDLLSGILDSEVKELESFMSTLQTKIISAREIISSCGDIEKPFKGIGEKLHDSEEFLHKLLEQIGELRVQASNFQRMLLSFGGEENRQNGHGTEFLENGDSSNLKIKMHTAEQQRHILRMLEKSLASELDLEKKVSESRTTEEDLKQMLNSLKQEVVFVDKETETTWERLFEADNIAEVLMGISKELLGRIRILQFNLNGSIQREEELKSKLQDSVEQLKGKEIALQKLESSNEELNEFLLSQTNTLKASLKEAEDKLVLTDSEAFTLREKVSLLEKQLKESEFELLNAKAAVSENEDLYSDIHKMENIIEDLKENLSKAESRTESAESKCKLLTETNIELNEEFSLLKSSGNSSDRIDLLEGQLRESEIRLQQAMASVDASREKESLLNSTIEDMGNLIENLKSMVSKAESQTESAEDKCIILSESNSDLNEEVSFLRGRMVCLEESLHRAEETKKATAKDISIRTKLITDLVMQLAFERERLQKQISSLRKENLLLIKHTNNIPVNISHDGKGTSLLSKRDFSETSFELDKMAKNIGLAETTSKLESSRNIDARQLNLKYVFLAVVLLVTSVFTAFLLRYPNCPF